MTLRKKNALFCFVSLTVGGLLYILFRPNTYVGEIFDVPASLATICQVRLPYAYDLLCFYLPDFLWGLSLSCGLIAIHTPGTKGIALCAGASFLCGCAWEVLQFLHIVSGTADIHDVIMYLFASAVCIILNLKEIKRE